MKRILNNDGALEIKKEIYNISNYYHNHFDSVLSSIRAKQINNTDFSIISNNCWGGYVYKRYGLPYLTPTVGLYFWADDYIKFCNNLEHYLNECNLEEISYSESKHRIELESRHRSPVPLGMLEDIEIVFMHYNSFEEARIKWNRRKTRVNFDNLIVKFSQMNNCTYKEVSAFEQLNYKKQFMFVSNDYSDFKSAIAITNSPEITNDTAFYSHYINLNKLINSSESRGNNFYY